MVRRREVVLPQQFPAVVVAVGRPHHRMQMQLRRPVTHGRAVSSAERPGRLRLVRANGTLEPANVATVKIIVAIRFDIA